MISIIVPIYQAEKTLKDCIESVLNQSSNEWELILIDDGSTDHSGQICDEYAQKNSNIVLKHISNSGVSNARNVGLSIANGSIIEFLDADDQLFPNAVEMIVDIMDNNNVDLLVFGAEFYYRDKLKKKKGIDRQYAGLDFLMKDFVNLVKDEYFNPPWNRAIKRKCIKTYFDETLSLGEDAVFNLSNLKNVHSIRFISNSLYKYNMASDGLTTRYNPNTIDAIKKRYMLLFELLNESFSDQCVELKKNIKREILYFYRLMGAGHNVKQIQSEIERTNEKMVDILNYFEITLPLLGRPNNTFLDIFLKGIIIYLYAKPYECLKFIRKNLKFHYIIEKCICKIKSVMDRN